MEPPIKVKGKTKFGKKVVHFLHANCNLSKSICTHLMGKEHTILHRICVGAVFMALGTIIGNIHLGVPHGDLITSGTGGLVHAIGATPVIEALSKA